MSYPVEKSKKKIRVIGSPSIISYPFGFFDGAIVSLNGVAFFSLDLNQTHLFLSKLGCGPNTNTRARLLALWALLFIASSMGLPSLHVCEYSVVVINWAVVCKLVALLC